MKKTDANFVIDLASLFVFLGLIMTGLVLFLVLPHGSGKSMVWGLTRHEWGDLHFWLAVGFVVLMVVHIIFHWNWIISMVRTRLLDKMSSMGRVGFYLFLLILAFLVIAPLLSPVVGAR